MTLVPTVLTDEEVYKVLVKEFPILEASQGRILISAPYMMPNIQAFKRFFSERGHQVIIAEVEERLEESDLEKYSKQYDVALIGDDRYSSKILKECGAKALCKWGTGIDSIDLDTAKELDIKVHNTVNAFSEPIAESILGSILAFNRGIIQSTEQMKNHRSWTKIQGKTLSEVSIGIVGVGNVGKTLLRKLLNLGGCKEIITYDILGKILTPSEFSERQVKQAGTLEELLSYSLDFLCLTCCQTQENIGMIGPAQLEQLNNNTIIINMARGRLIQEDALIKALIGGRLGGAALDVFWDEPLASDSILRSLPNVLLSSHNANSSPKYWLQVHVNTIRNALPYVEKISH